MFTVIGAGISSCAERYSNPKYFIDQWEIEEERKLKALEEEKKLKKEEKKNRKLVVENQYLDTTAAAGAGGQEGGASKITSGALSLKDSVSALRADSTSFPSKPAGRVIKLIVHQYIITQCGI